MTAPMQQAGIQPAFVQGDTRLERLRQDESNLRQRAALVRTIEDQIVPRLLISRAPLESCPSSQEPGLPSSSREVLDLVALALGPDDDAARHFILEAARRQTLQGLCLNLLQPAAWRLGDLWTEDLASFTEVTIAMVRLHEGLHAVIPPPRDNVADQRRHHRILLAPAPGDDHRFGLTMVSAFFEQAGWMVAIAQDETIADLEDMLRRDWFAVLGFSVSADVHLAKLKAAIPRLRAASRNRDLSVMVGGPVFIARPDLLLEVGADATAADGVQATWVAENMLAGRAPYS